MIPGRTPSMGGSVERIAARILDDAADHYDAAPGLDPVPWACTVAAGHALVDAVAGIIDRPGIPDPRGIALRLYVARHGAAPWDHHGPPPLLPTQPTLWETT